MTERRSKYNAKPVEFDGIRFASEHEEQVALFEWAAGIPELRWMFAIPNGTRTTPGIARRMKAEGVLKGVSDIFLPLPRNGHAGLFIEMKAARGSATPEQREFIEAMRDAGYAAFVCHGFDKAKQVITEYLQGGGNGTA